MHRPLFFVVINVKLCNKIFKTIKRIEEMTPAERNNYYLYLATHSESPHLPPRRIQNILWKKPRRKRQYKRVRR